VTQGKKRPNLSSNLSYCFEKGVLARNARGKPKELRGEKRDDIGRKGGAAPDSLRDFIPNRLGKKKKSRKGERAASKPFNPSYQRENLCYPAARNCGAKRNGRKVKPLREERI